jgi:hypothetical protein
MKTFSQFVTEAKEVYDQQGLGSGVGLSHRGGTKIGHDRKKQEKSMPSPHSKGDKPKARVKAIGGGKTAPAKDYKQRSDAGKQRPKGRSTEREQQPTRERGSAGLSAREQQRKAAKERRAAKSSGKSKKDLKKAADKLLTTKKDTTSPNYKPQKASGYTAHERRKIMRSGERLVRDIKQKKDKPAAHYDPGVKKNN